MNALVVNLVLATAWAALRGALNLENLAFGFLLGYAVIAAVRPTAGAKRYATRVPRGIGLLAFFLWELLLSTLRVTWDVITPSARRRPGVVAVPLDAETDVEITLLSCLITLTPGTLTLDISEDRKTLFVHAMFVDDPEKLRRALKVGFERRVLEFLR